jgi:hypothetical protein
VEYVPQKAEGDGVFEKCPDWGLCGPGVRIHQFRVSEGPLVLAIHWWWPSLELRGTGTNGLASRGPIWGKRIERNRGRLSMAALFTDRISPL